MQCINEETRITYSHDQQQFNVRELIKHWNIFSNQTDVNGDCFLCLGNENTEEPALRWLVTFRQSFPWIGLDCYPKFKSLQMIWCRWVGVTVFMRGVIHEKLTLVVSMTFLNVAICSFIVLSMVLKYRKYKIMHYFTKREYCCCQLPIKYCKFSWVLCA